MKIFKYFIIGTITGLNTYIIVRCALNLMHGGSMEEFIAIIFSVMSLVVVSLTIKSDKEVTKY